MFVGEHAVRINPDQQFVGSRAGGRAATSKACLDAHREECDRNVGIKAREAIQRVCARLRKLLLQARAGGSFLALRGGDCRERLLLAAPQCGYGPFIEIAGLRVEESLAGVRERLSGHARCILA